MSDPIRFAGHHPACFRPDNCACVAQPIIEANDRIAEIEAENQRLRKQLEYADVTPASAVAPEVAVLRENQAALAAKVQELEAQAAGMREALLAQRDWYERALKSMAARGEVSDGLMFQEPRVRDLVAAALASDAGRALLERLEKAERVNNRRLCGCEESLGVFGCRVACPCRCHEARARALEEAAQLLERYPKPKYIKGLAAAILALCGKKPE